MATVGVKGLMLRSNFNVTRSWLLCNFASFLMGKWSDPHQTCKSN